MVCAAQGLLADYQRPWQSPVPPLLQSIEKVEQYPSDEEESGMILIGWRGPKAKVSNELLLLIIRSIIFWHHNCKNLHPDRFSTLVFYKTESFDKKKRIAQSVPGYDCGRYCTFFFIGDMYWALGKLKLIHALWLHIKLFRTSRLQRKVKGGALVTTLVAYQLFFKVEHDDPPCETTCDCIHLWLLETRPALLV